MDAEDERPPSGRLRDAREARGSQETVAAELGVRAKTLAAWETGKRSPQADNAAAIERMFGIPARSWRQRRQEVKADRLLVGARLQALEDAVTDQATEIAASLLELDRRLGTLEQQLERLETLVSLVAEQWRQQGA